MKVVIFLLLVSILNISLAKEESRSLTVEKSVDGINTLTRNSREAGRKKNKNARKKRKERRQRKKETRFALGRKKKTTKKNKKNKGAPRWKKGRNQRKRKSKNGSGARKESGGGGGRKQRKSGRNQRKKKMNGKKKCSNGKCRKSRKRGGKPKKTKKDKVKVSPNRHEFGRATSCNATAFILKTKRFNKIQTEARLAKRIDSFSTQMSNKKNTSASTFADSLTAINESTNAGTSCGSANSSAEEKAVYDKLKNCSNTAAAACNAGNSTVAVDASLAKNCIAGSEKFVKDFKECLKDVSTACACALALTEPESKCLDFKAMADALKVQKQRCTKGTNPGSFGDCRKQERMAAKFANKCKTSTCPTPSCTTVSPSGRRRDFRFSFEKLLNKN